MVSMNSSTPSLSMSCAANTSFGWHTIRTGSNTAIALATSAHACWYRTSESDPVGPNVKLPVGNCIQVAMWGSHSAGMRNPVVMMSVPTAPHHGSCPESAVRR